MSRATFSGFYYWLGHKLYEMYGKSRYGSNDEYRYFIEVGNENHPCYYIGLAEHKFEIINPTQLLIDGKDIIDLPEPIRKVEINPFSSGKNSARDIYFESEAKQKIEAWMKRNGLS